MSGARSTLTTGVVLEFNHRSTTTPMYSSYTHAKLKAAENKKREINARHYNSVSAIKNLNTANILTAELGYVYSDVDAEESDLGELLTAQHVVANYAEPDQTTFNVQDFYSGENIEGNGNYTINSGFYGRMQQRYNNAVAAVNENPAIRIKNINTEPYDNGQFCYNFHHSEQALAECLESDATINAIVEDIRRSRVATLGAIVLDIHSTRDLCCNCHICLIGLKNSARAGFIQKLKAAILAVMPRMQFPDTDLQVIVRVSSEKPGKNNAIPDKTLRAQRGLAMRLVRATDTTLILQEDSTNLDLDSVIREEAYTLNNYSGDFFTSRAMRKECVEQELMERYMPKRDTRRR